MFLKECCTPGRHCQTQKHCDSCDGYFLLEMRLFWNVFIDLDLGCFS